MGEAFMSFGSTGTFRLRIFSLLLIVFDIAAVQVLNDFKRKKNIPLGPRKAESDEFGGA